MYETLLGVALGSLLVLVAGYVVRARRGATPGRRAAVTGEELRELLSRRAELRPEERAILADLFAAGDRLVREVMHPRTEVEFLEASIPVHRAAGQVASLPHSRYPVVRATADDVVGYVHVRDLLAPSLARRNVRVGEIARRIEMLPGTKRVLPALDEMRRRSAHIAIVVDEYGGTAGIVTLEDLIEELVGDIRDERDPCDDVARPGASGDLTVDGLLKAAEFAEHTGITLPDGPYETVAGFVMARLARVPSVGDVVFTRGGEIEVLAMEGRRASLLAVRSGGPGEGGADLHDADGPAAG